MCGEKLVNREIMTVVWPVGDLHFSHKEIFEVTDFYQYSSTINGGKLKGHMGNIHYYLGIYLYYSEPGVVKL